jgi:hypothetical protein
MNKYNLLLQTILNYKNEFMNEGDISPLSYKKLCLFFAFWIYIHNTFWMAFL